MANPLLMRAEPASSRTTPSSSTPTSPRFFSPRGLLQMRTRSRDGGADHSKQQGTVARWLMRALALCVALSVVGYAAHAGLSWTPLGCSSSSPRAVVIGNSEPCSYGDLPGYWKPEEGHTVGTWKVFDPRCQLEDMVEKHIQMATWNITPEAGDDVGILLLGDSADRNLIYDFCVSASGQVEPFNINLTEHGPKTCNRGESWGTYKDVVNCNTCRVPGLRITKESIWGFFETRAPEDRLGLPLERTQEGLEQFRREHGRYPDLVVLHSNYWDIAQVVLFRWWEGWEPEYTQLMLDWLARAEKVATYLEAMSAKTGMLVAYRTVQYPQMANCNESAKAMDHQIGYRYQVTYLNAAGRELARRHNMFLVDIELMFQKFWSSHEFLSDNHHLNSNANRQVLNIYLNLLRNRAAAAGGLPMRQKGVASALRRTRWLFD